MHKHSLVATVRVGPKDLRERGSDVFLPFGTDYHLHLHNKADRPVLAFIRVDGRLIDGGRARRIEPGERCEVEGFAQDDGRVARFRFTQRTGAVERHRGKRRGDGLVEVFFAADERARLIEEFERAAKELAKKWERQGSPLRQIWWDDPVLPRWDDPVLPPGGVRPRPASPWGPCPWRLNPWGPLTYGQNGQGGGPMFSDRTVAEAQSSSGDAGDRPAGLTVPGAFTNDGAGASREAESSWRKVSESASLIRLRLNGAWQDGSAVETPLFARERLQCATCGKRHKSSARFCDHCGTNLKAVA